MENMLEAFRFFHFLGLGLFLGASISSVLVVHSQKKTLSSIKLAWDLMHMMAAPGLVLLISSGILIASAQNWAPFKSGGYMHVKIFLVLLVFVALFMDLRRQKKIMAGNLSNEQGLVLINKRQILSALSIFFTLIIMCLVTIRPF